MTQFFVHKSSQLGHVMLTEAEWLTQCETFAILEKKNRQGKLKIFYINC